MDSRFSSVGWHKSTRSAIGNCVEVTTVPVDGLVGVRDTKNRQGAALAIPMNSWEAFLSAVRDGEFF